MASPNAEHLIVSRNSIVRGGASAAVGAALWLAVAGVAAAQTPEPSAPGIDQPVTETPATDLVPQPALSPSTNQVAPGSLLPPGTGPAGLLPGADGGPTDVPSKGSDPATAGPPGGTSGAVSGGLSGGGSPTLRDPTVAATIGRSLREFQDTDDSLGGMAERAAKLAVPLAAPIAVATLGLIGLLMMAKGTGRLESLETEREALGGRTVIRL